MNYLVFKIIAAITMMIDHIGVVFGETGLRMISGKDTVFLRSIGRIAFPIFMFTIVNGWKHTRDKGKYLSRLILFMSISQIPYMLAFKNLQHIRFSQMSHHSIPTDLILIALIFFTAYFSEVLYRPVNLIYLGIAMFFSVFNIEYAGIALNSTMHLNVFYTLACGAIAISGIEGLMRWIGSTGEAKRLQDLLKPISAFLICFVLAKHSDYGFLGTISIACMYLVRDFRLGQLLVMAGWAVQNYTFTTTLYSYFSFALLGVLLIALYNDKKGPSVPWLQPFFYYFYPVHLLILGIIRYNIGRFV